MQQISKDVLNNSNKSYEIRLDNQNKPLNIVTNFGLKEGEIGIRNRGNEYNGFSIQAMENIKPLLTNKRISRALELLSEENLQGVISVLNIEEDVKSYGIDVIFFILKIWLEKNNFTIPNEIMQRSKINVNCDKLAKWITSVSHDPIIGKIKVVGIGQTKGGGSVVPEEWMGRIFESGEKLHKEMDKLDWRKGKPPVNFCCIYSMDKVDSYNWTNDKKYILNLLPNIKPEYGFIINDDAQCNVFQLESNNWNEWNEWINKSKKKDFLPGNVIVRGKITNVIFALDKSKIINPNPVFSSDCENVGILVSQLQKAIRRGRHCPNLLINCIKCLSKSHPYNLPDQQFIRVSGCRQLLWRLFITIIEDAHPYNVNKKDEGKLLRMLDLFSLALLCQIDPNIVLCDKIIEKVLNTALSIQYNDKVIWKWREGKLSLDKFSKFSTCNFNSLSLYLSLQLMPMMKNDTVMITKGLNKLNDIKCISLDWNPIEFYKKNSNIICEKESMLASYDMHCLPQIILYSQGSLPFIPTNEKLHSTKSIPGHIWTEISRKNVRDGNKISKDNDIINLINIIKSIQEFHYNKCKNLFTKITINPYIKPNSHNTTTNKSIVTSLITRTAFLLLFGKKYKISHNNKIYDVIVAGTTDAPCKVKKYSKSKNEYIDGEERSKLEKLYFNKMKTGENVVLPNPPNGYKWIFPLNTKTVKISADIVKNKFVFYVNEYKLEPFNANKIIEKIPSVKNSKLEKCDEDIINDAFFINPTTCEQFTLNRKLREISLYKKQKKDFRALDWVKIAKKSKDISLLSDLFKKVLVKINSNYNNTIQIGPVDRNGKKVNDAISYMSEGVLWRMFNLLSYLYPNVINVGGHLKFKLNTKAQEYEHMMNSINEIAFINKNNNKIQSSTKIKINTKLWDHQKQTSERISYGLISEGRKGFGDASHVGAGKTLTALTVSANIINHNINKKIYGYSGILVLLPTTKLYKTWKDEVEKHTNNFHLLFQNSDGKITDNIQGDKCRDKLNIRYNTLLITTLGRMRDHPISVSWQLVIIDECLSVQNRDALQTEEAWKQVICSQFGVIMMSATFFRSRFDKMFYMLKMLRCGLPETKEYLDTILSECMVCYIPTNTRKWTTNTTKYELDKTLQKKYNNIKAQNMPTEKMYQALHTFLYSQCNFVEMFKKKINEIGKNKCALIYARSKKEADDISKKIANVSRYPDKSKTHVVVSYTEGTYGLNDLVGFNTIITRPPEPDKLLQMKGRLDREGQKSNELYLEYILTKETIEEAWLIRLEIANNFYKNHIMPLAEFYKIAIGLN